MTLTWRRKFTQPSPPAGTHPGSGLQPESSEMKRNSIGRLSMVIVALSAAHVNAADRTRDEGPYVGAALGRSSFSAKTGLPTTASDEVAVGGKLYGGYRFNGHFGVEAGYVRFGSLAQSVTLGGSTVEQGAKGRSLYVAATGRMPVAQHIALLGKAGVSFGKVSGADVLPASAQLVGSRRSLMAGIGAEYQLSPQVALTVDFDHFGKLSDRARANLLSAGVRYSF
jgi:OmpA-OmpF porin, OOP family